MGNKQLAIKNTLDTSMINRAVLGAGCFWCIEAALQRLRGVSKVESGYAGGFVKNPTYDSVCSGKSGHAEVVRVQFDPKIISYETILFIFMHIHDPTTVNRQGYDTGSQYRSIIFYEKGNNKQQEAIRAVLEEVKKEGQYPGHPAEIVTEVKELQEFYPAQQFHQDYYNSNPNQGYCKAIIKPKIGKLKDLFKDYVDPAKL